MAKKKIERRTKAELDGTVLSKVLAVVSIGGSKADGARSAGITAETVRKYEIRGARGEEPFASWLVELRSAQVETKVYVLGLIQKAVRGDWRAGAWLLEKLFPKEFGHLVKIEGTLDANVTGLDISKLSVADLRELKRLRAKMVNRIEGRHDGDDKETKDGSG